jgi:hypothetical protein|tara:strand:+ start:68 stop:232 length:165 start_codon:yes stop_codon:yes gene_type:complete
MQKNIIVESWIATVTLHNGQTVEQEFRAKSFKKGREILKRDSQIKKILNIRKKY